MKVRVVLVSAAVAATAGAGLFAINPADANPAKATTHTIKVRLHETGTLNYGQTASSGTDKASSKGKAVGFDVVHFSGTSGDVALSLKKGLLYGHLTYHVSTGKITGKVTGGTGGYKNAKGTLSATSVNTGGTITDVVIKWHK